MVSLAISVAAFLFLAWVVIGFIVFVIELLSN